MADIEAEAKEMIVNTIAGMAQIMMDNNGIQLQSVDIQWEDQSIAGEPVFRVTNVTANISMVNREVQS